MIAYKLVRVKRGKLFPLFINKSHELPIGEWLQAEAHRTKGFAYRPGWHCTLKPEAPHLKMNLASGEKRVWVKLEIGENYRTYSRPESQGGTWILADKIKICKILGGNQDV